MSANLHLGRWGRRDEVTDWLDVVARRLVDPGVELPLLVSADWVVAPDNIKLASALRAARAWYLDGLCATQNAADELSRARWAQQYVDAQEWAEIASWVREMALAPTHAELVERRREVVLPAAREAS